MSQVQDRLVEIEKKGMAAVNDLRHKTAHAALEWVSAHRNRIASFRRSVKGTPVEAALDSVLGFVRAEGRTPKTGHARRSKATRRH